MDEIEFTWKWNNEFLDIKIFKDNKLFGHIPKFLDKTISTINSNKYFLDSKLFQTNTFIIDPTDNKAYCEIQGDRIKDELILIIKAPAFQYICSSEQKLLFGQKICRVTNNNKEVMTLTISQGLFVDSGKLYLLTNDSNVELLIYCLFYFNTMTRNDY